MAPHHFIDFAMPDDYYSAGLFGDQASARAEEIFSRGRLPVVVGGSGLYIKAMCEGLFKEDNTPASKTAIRQSLDDKFNNFGIDTLYSELMQVDSKSALKYTDKNPRRIIRALEYYYTTGTPISKEWQDSPAQRNFNVVYFGIMPERPALYEKINLRSEIMWKSGLVEETERVISMGYSPALNSLNTVGYKETIDHLNGKITAIEALEKIKQNTRRYAKRQMTWFRRNSSIHWIEGPPEDTAQIIYKNLARAHKQFL
jgi:tRNA dimethylallyltransferase